MDKIKDFIENILFETGIYNTMVITSIDETGEALNTIVTNNKNKPLWKAGDRKKLEQYLNKSVAVLIRNYTGESTVSNDKKYPICYICGYTISPEPGNWSFKRLQAWETEYSCRINPDNGKYMDAVPGEHFL